MITRKRKLGAGAKEPAGGVFGHGGQTRLAYKVLSLKNTQIQTAQIHIPSITEKYPCE